MKTVRIPSPARSQGAGPRTPIRHKHLRSRSVSSARSNASGRLAVLVQQNKNMDSFAMSPFASRRSILSDNTEIGEPRRKSWWRNLGENSRDVIELLDEDKIVEPNNIIEELDIEILSQEKKNYTMDLPESSDSESINSIVIPQRKLFTQKENLPHKKFGEIIGTRETLAKLHKPSTNDHDKTVNVAPRELFQNKQRSKPIFPAALLNISPNKTAADKTKDLATLEPNAQVRNIFGNRAPKRKNIFTNFIVSESEDEIPEIQPKVFGFQKKMDARRRGSSSSRGMRELSPASSITTDIEMDDWKMLPSSTMVENQLEITVADGMSPKRMRLSKLTEIESETGSNATKQSSKSASSKDTDKSRKSKTFTKEKACESDFVTQNKSKISQDEDEDGVIFELNEEASDKSRKSKTFTKEKVRQSDSMTTRNKSKSYQNYDEEMEDQNGSSKDKDKSRKSKTFTKEKAANFSSMANKNKSIASKDEDEIFDQAQNKSKTKIADQNTSQSSIKTRSQTNSPNSSKINYEQPIIDDTSETTMKKNKSKNIVVNPNSLNIESDKTRLLPSQENDDDELNFTLVYENEDQNDEEMPETLQNESKTRTRASKNETHQGKSFNVSECNKPLSNKVIEESAELEYTHEKSSRSMKVTHNSQAKNTSKEKIEEDHEQIDHHHDALNNSNSKNEEILMEVNENETRSSKFQQETVENQNEDVNNKSHVNISKQVDNNNQNVLQHNDNGPEKNNDSEVDVSEPQNESEVDVSEPQNESEVEKSQELVEENDETNEIEDQNESQEIENASGNEEEQQQSLEKQDESEPENESQELEDDVDGNNESQDVEDDIDGNNESQEVEDDIDGNNESREVEDDIDGNNESQEVENDIDGKNESQELEDDIDGNNESQEVEDESEEEKQNESQEDSHNKSQEGPQNASEAGQNESEVEQNEVENHEESEAIADSDNDHDEANYSQDDVANDSDNENTNQIESGHVDDESTQEDNEKIETPNVSHDTTGRNRKKNESPEAILHESKNHLHSFAVEGRNTSVRKTEMIKSMHIRPSLESVRESNEFSDGSKASTEEGSGWDSHRTTRKTLRQTYGRDFTPRKSLRALVMEKSAKRQTQHKEVGSETFKYPQANSTELPETTNRFEDDVDEVDENQVSNHEVSLRTRQTTLEMYLQKIKKKNAESRHKLEEAVQNSLNAQSKYHEFKVPARPLVVRRATKPKQTKSTLFFGQLPAEVIEDFKYKPPKRFQPSNAPWITKRLYKYLESKLEAKYDYKARIRAEKLVESMYHFAKDLRRHEVASSDAVDVLKREMARLGVVKTHFEFYEFFHQFMPREVRVKVNPDVVNKISLPRQGVFSDIL